MAFTIVKSIKFSFRIIYKNMKMAIWHITTHFVVEGHISLGFNIFGVKILRM